MSTKDSERYPNNEESTDMPRRVLRRMFVLQESMWGPAPAVNPNITRSSSGTNKVSSASARYTAGEDTKKNKKKKKMQKLDSSILGFTVHAAPDRVNAGEIHYT